MAQTPVEALRLYGVAAVESNAVRSLAEGTTIVPFRLLGAVVAPTKYSRVAVDEAEVGEYTRILEEVQSSTAVLPAPPGTVFRTRDIPAMARLHTHADAAIALSSPRSRVTITKSPRRLK